MMRFTKFFKLTTLSLLAALLIAFQFSQAGRTLAQMPGMELGTDYHLTLATDPAAITPGEPFTLTLNIFEPDGTTPVAQFDEEHTKLLHLIMVSEDLSQFLHVHPDYQGDGVFVLKDADLPAPAHYTVFADFVPTGGVHQVARATLATQDAQTAVPDLQVSEPEIVTDALRIHLDIPDTLNAGEDTNITFHIRDAQTSDPVKTLDEYLGAAGHLVIIDQTSQVYIHTHPSGEAMPGMNMGVTATPGMDMGGMSMSAQYGPDITFMTHFPTAGLYKMWLQVQYKGQIEIAPFVVEVGGTTEATLEAPQANVQETPVESMMRPEVARDHIFSYTVHAPDGTKITVDIRGNTDLLRNAGFPESGLTDADLPDIQNLADLILLNMNGDKIIPVLATDYQILNSTNRPNLATGLHEGQQMLNISLDLPITINMITDVNLASNMVPMFYDPGGLDFAYGIETRQVDDGRLVIDVYQAPRDGWAGVWGNALLFPMQIIEQFEDYKLHGLGYGEMNQDFAASIRSGLSLLAMSPNKNKILEAFNAFYTRH